MSDRRRRIVLVRHAQSAHVQNGWVDAVGFRAWREAYEAAGIRPEERAPAELQRLVERAGVVLASDAARAEASARLIAGGRDVVVSPLFRELDLEALAPRWLRVPLPAWALLVGCRTLVLALQGRYPSESESARLNEAAIELQQLSTRHELVVVFTHAMLRRHLFRRLVSEGWKAEPGRRSMEHWSAWVVSRSD